jgi:hypothetical protein
MDVNNQTHKKSMTKLRNGEYCRRTVRLLWQETKKWLTLLRNYCQVRELIGTIRLLPQSTQKIIGCV